MAAFWGVAAHSVYDMFSWHKYLRVILAFSHPSVYTRKGQEVLSQVLYYDK